MLPASTLAALLHEEHRMQTPTAAAVATPQPPLPPHQAAALPPWPDAQAQRALTELFPHLRLEAYNALRELFPTHSAP